MAIYLQTEEDEIIQIGTNQGWGDICRLAESRQDLPYLRKLTDRGEARNGPKLRANVALAASYAAEKPLQDSLAQPHETLSTVKGHGLVITDGLSPEEGAEYESTSG